MKYKYKQVLLVDDEELDNFVNQKLISINSFSNIIYVNSSAISALEFLSNLLKLGEKGKGIFPEAIFIDINMPIISGFEFIVSLKNLLADSQLNPKLVILTSSVSAKDKTKAYELDPQIYFAIKPLSEKQLSEI